MLIKIENINGSQAVSARELYLFLSVDNGSNFTKWAKINIEDMFEQNSDYQSLRVNGDKGGRPSTDYALTLDVAKEVSMMSKCAKGKQARKYFIDAEKQLQAISKTLTPAEQFLQLAQLNVELERKQKDHDVRISSVEDKLNNMLEIQASNQAELKAIPVSVDVLPEMRLRDKVRLLVNRYAQHANLTQQTVWDNLYQTLFYTYHVSIKSYKKIKEKETWLEVADRNNHIDKLYIVISNMLKQKGLAA